MHVHNHDKDRARPTKSFVSLKRTFILMIAGALLVGGVASTSVLAAAPSAPENLNLTPGVGEIELSWDPPLDDGGLGIDQYNVHRGADGDSLAFLTSTVDSSFTDTGLADGETWFYAVSAENLDGEGPLSSAASASTHDVPTAAQNLAATGGNAEIDLDWDPPADDGGSPVTDYEIHSGTETGVLSLLDTIDAASTSYSHTGLGDDETHFYHVIAVNAVGDSPASGEVSATTFGVPSAPQGLVATGNDGNISLSWDAPADDGGSAITGYEVFGSDDEAGPFVSLGATDPGTREFTESPLDAGVVRQYRVNATNEVGAGPSAGANATTDPPIRAGGGGGVRSSAHAEARSTSTALDSLRSYRTYSTHLQEGGTLSVFFPDADDVLDGVEVRVADHRYHVSLRVDVLDPEKVGGLSEATGFAGLDQLRIELHDQDGPLDEEAIELAVVTLKSNEAEMSELPGDALMLMRLDEGTGLWQAQPTEVTTLEDGQVLVQANLSGFSRFALALDVEAPEVDFASGMEAHGASDPVVFTVSDNHGVSSVELLIDGTSVDLDFDGTNASYTPEVPWEPGMYALAAIVTDESGNVEVHEATMTVQGDDAEDAGGSASQEDGPEAKGSPAAGIAWFFLLALAGLSRLRRCRRP